MVSKLSLYPPLSLSAMATPSNPLALLSTIQNLMPHKLDGTNYILWKHQLTSILKTQSLFGFLDGSERCPSKFIVAADGSVTESIDPAFKAWQIQDQAILTLINVTLSQEALSQVIGLSDSRSAWLVLEARYASLSRANIISSKSELQTVKKDSDSIDSYLQQLKRMVALSKSPPKFHAKRGVALSKSPPKFQNVEKLLDGLKRSKKEEEEEPLDKGKKTVDLPVIENRHRLASGKCKEVPLNTEEEEEEDHAKKRSEMGDSVKRAKLSQMDADLPSTETTKDVALHKGKKDCEIGAQGLARKERFNLDRLKQVISSNDRKSIPHFSENHQMDVDSPRKKLQKDSDVVSLRKETQKDKSLSNDKGLCDLDETKQGESIVVSTKRALPPSVTGQGENAKRGVALSKPPPKFQNVEKLLDGLKRVVEKLGEGYDDDETDIDFFEMAKRRGVTFPRPRWWPPGGFD